MSSRTVFLFAALALSACGEGPTEPPVADTLMRLCVGDARVAVRNEGRPWIPVPTQNGVAEFLATERLGLVLARLDPQSPFVRVLYLTAAQAQVYACKSSEPVPPSTFTGVVGGLGTGEHADIAYGGGSMATVSWIDSTFGAYVLPGSNDLVATHQPPYATAQHVDQAIIRRAQSYPADTEIRLDFGSPEAFPLAEHALRWTSPYAWIQVNFRTASGTDNLLQSSAAGVPGSGESPHDEIVYSIPASRLAPGDLHELFLSSDDRTIRLYYHEPQDRTVVLGPPGSQPVFTTLGTSLHSRIRVEVPSQPEYAGSIGVSYAQSVQPGMTTRIVASLEASREYFNGTPAAWRLEVPDLSGMIDFDFPPGDYDWGVTIFSAWGWGRPELASDGSLQRSASVYGTRRH